MHDALEVILAVVVLCCACVASWAGAHSTVATECEKLGAFYVGTKVYECKLKGGKDAE